MNAEQLADRLAVEATLYTVADAIDRRDRPQYRSVFTDEIDLDSSSYRPGTVGRVGADEWVDRATRLFPGHGSDPRLCARRPRLGEPPR